MSLGKQRLLFVKSGNAQAERFLSSILVSGTV